MDLIDRQAAIDALKRRGLLFIRKRVDFLMLSEKDKARIDEIDTCISELLNLPAVQPERKKGKWIDHGSNSWECSCCGAQSYVDEDWRPTDDKSFKMNYCHYCGAEMESDT